MMLETFELQKTADTAHTAARIIEPARDTRHTAWFLALAGFCIAYALSALSILPLLRHLPVENEWTFGPTKGKYAMGYYGYLLNGASGMALLYLPARFFSFGERARAAALYSSGSAVALSFLILTIYEIKRWC